MGNIAHRTTSPFWTASVSLPQPPRLEKNLDVDVCVIGGGIAGITTAYLLARSGYRVCLIEQGKLGGQQTTVTTAHLSNMLDNPYSEIERLHGHHAAQHVALSHGAAIDLFETVAREEQIECDFRRLDGYLYSVENQGAELQRELEVISQLGVIECSWVEKAPIARQTGGCLRIKHQAEFHPLKFMAGLLPAIQRLGGECYTDTHATEVHGGSEARVVTAHGSEIRCRQIVVATNTPVNDWTTMHTKQYPYRTYAIAARYPRGSITPGLYWDTENPYHYSRLQADDTSAGEYELLIVGGEDHKTGQANDTDARFARLEDYTRRWFGDFEEVAYQWSGQVMNSMDALGFIGRNPGDEKNVYIITGDTGSGMTHGAIGAMLLTDLIGGRNNPWEAVYDPARKTLKAAAEFAKENFNVATQYGSWLTPGEVTSVNDIAPGEGAIMRRGVKKLAVYRNQQGEVCCRSAVCPHLGCIVSWNPSDETWNCPCHGSQFSPEGKVRNGPANTDLPEESL